MKKVRPNNVPRDYVLQIQKSLQEEGLELTKDKIRHVLRGNVKDIELTMQVSQKLKMVKEKYRKKLRELKKIRKNFKK